MKSTFASRKSYHTSIKIYAHKGLLPKHLIKLIPSSTVFRWKNETIDKYENCPIYNYVNQDSALLEAQNEFPSSKRIAWAYIELLKGLYTIFNQIKGFHKIIQQNKEVVVDTIERVGEFISVKEAVKLFRISRATYQNYKVQVLNKCDASYVFWCVKRYPQQLLNKEIVKIKEYFQHPDYQFWSKSSVYYAGLRQKDFGFCLGTFYKYASLLGIKNGRHLQKKIHCFPLKSTLPNQIWCADVTIHKTPDGVKHYLHLLLDHYSRKIIGYQIGSRANPKIIKGLLENAFKLLSNSNKIVFVTDAGVENVNATVKEYIASTGLRIIHQIAQQDIRSSNSTIEAVNKTLKHQYFYQPHIQTSTQFLKELSLFIENYNTIRPQHYLRGNTPEETYQGKTVSISHYNAHFMVQKDLRKTQNQANKCKKCI